MLPGVQDWPLDATGMPSRFRIAKIFSLFSAASATLPGGRLSKAAEIGSIGARREVCSVTGCASRVEPGTGN